MDGDTYFGVKFDQLISRLTQVWSKNIRILQRISFSKFEGFYEEKNKLGLHGVKRIHRRACDFGIPAGYSYSSKLKIL